jgi:hypothetical protein
MLPDPKPLSRSLVDWDQQVLYLLIIDIQHRYIHFKLFVFVFVRMYSAEDFFTTDWYNAFVCAVADHRVRLTRTGLPVCKQATMVTLPCIVENLCSDAFINKLLVGILVASLPTFAERLT